MWYDERDKNEYKMFSVNLWSIRWDRVNKMWTVGGYIKDENQPAKRCKKRYMVVFTAEDKYDAVQYAETNVSPTASKTKKFNSAAGAGAQSGVRASTQEKIMHIRLESRNKTWKSTAGKAGGKAMRVKHKKEKSC